MTYKRPCIERLAGLAVVAVLTSAAAGWAQESTGSVAAGFVASIGTSGGSSSGFFGEAAFNTSDTMAVAGRAQRFAIGFGASLTRLEGGVRIYGQPNNIRPFGQFMAGLARFGIGGFGFGEGFEDFSFGGFSANGFALSPGGGVDIEVGERIAIRVLGEWQMNSIGGGTSNAIGVLFGLAFDFGDQ